MSETSNGSGSQTQAKVGVLMALSSPLANLLKAQASKGWSSDIMTEVLGGFVDRDNRVAFSVSWGLACEGRILGLAG